MATDGRGSPNHGGAVKSLETAFDVIDAVERLTDPGVTDVAEEVGLAKSTVFDHLRTLEANHFVVKTDDDTYRIGLRFLDYGGKARSERELYRIAKPELEKLAEETGELVNLVVEEQGMGIYLDYIRGQDSVNLDTYIGKREYLHSTAFGKAMLAHMPAPKVDEIVDRHGLAPETDRTVTSRSALDERLENVRERGYAIDREERLNGLRCVAAPVTPDDGEVIGAVSISGPTGRLQDNRLTEELADEAMRTTNIIEINRAYSNP